MRYLIALTLLAACDELPQDNAGAVDTGMSELPTDQSPVVMASSPEWDGLLWYELDPAYTTNTLYARATAQLSLGCSGALVDDDILVTAAHCGGAPNTTMTATFGMYGYNSAFTEAKAEAREKLSNLGVRVSDVESRMQASNPGWTPAFVSQILDQTLSTYTCTFLNREGTRDVAYWRCNPNQVSWTEARVVPNYFASATFLPGHIWGHMNVSTGGFSDNQQIALASVNRTCTDPFNQALLSPGIVEDANDSCWGPYTNCFDTDVDMEPGSSGGPLFDRATNRLTGVLNGHYWWWFGNENDPCDRWTAATNMGSYIGTMVNTWVGAEPTGGGTPTGTWTAPTARVGGTTGTPHSFACPEGMLVAGVLGTTDPSWMVGNLGLICMPKRADTRLRYDRALVTTGGSIDIGLRTAVNTDLNTYLHEVRSTSTLTPGVQTVAMCPPGQFVQSIEAYTSTYTNRIETLNCATPDRTRTSRVRPFTENNRIGWTGAGTLQTGACAADSFWAGGTIQAGWLTDGFQGWCRRAQ